LKRIKKVKFTISINKINLHIQLLKKLKTYLIDQIELNSKMKNFLFNQMSGFNSSKFLNKKSQYFSYFKDENPEKKQFTKTENDYKFIEKLYSIIPITNLLYKMENKSIERCKPTPQFLEKFNRTIEEEHNEVSLFKMVSIFLEILELFKLLGENSEVLPASSDVKVFQLIQTPIEKIFLNFE
jgi:hypothetical protein